MKTLAIILMFPLSALCDNDFDKNKFRLNKFNHQNQGCPINSECSKTNGNLIMAWEKMLSMADSKSVGRMVRKFKKKTGLPISFLTSVESREKIDPILFKSRCTHHNPKNPNNKIYKGTKFLNTTKSTEHMIFDKITLHDTNGETLYSVPYQDIPIMIKDNQLIITKDYDDDFYQLAVSPKAQLTVIDVDLKVLRRAMNKRIKEVKCPNQMEIDKTYHQSTYCQKIWDQNSNSLKTIQISWSCP